MSGRILEKSTTPPTKKTGCEIDLLFGGMVMKIILNDFVPHLGAPGDRVEVAAGYARNYLIPKKLGIEATEGAIRDYEGNIKQRARKLARTLTEVEERKKQLEGLDALVFTRKSGEEGKLFGSVTSADIEAKLAEKGFLIEKKQIELKQPIKIVSQTEVIIKLHSGVSAVVSVKVEAQAVEKEVEEESDEIEEEETKEKESEDL